MSAAGTHRVVRAQKPKDSGSAVCKPDDSSNQKDGNNSNLRITVTGPNKSEEQGVCKFWLQGHCKYENDPSQCHYLHETSTMTLAPPPPNKKRKISLSLDAIKTVSGKKKHGCGEVTQFLKYMLDLFEKNPSNPSCLNRKEVFEELHRLYVGFKSR